MKTMPHVFNHFPQEVKCPICHTNTDGPTVLVEITGTAKDGLSHGKPIHLSCSMAQFWNEYPALAFSQPNQPNNQRN